MMAEMNLITDENCYRTVFEEAAVGLARVALNGQFLRANPKLCDLSGYTEAELLARNFQELAHPDDLSPHLAQIRKIRAGEITTYSLEKRCLRKGGALMWVRLSVALVRTATGAPDYFIAVVEDISEHKRLSQTLEDNERHFQRVLDQILAFAGILTPEGVLQFANRTALDAAGLAPEDVVGKPFANTSWWSWSEAAQQRVQEAIRRAAAGEVVRYDDQVCLAGRRIADIEFSIVALRDAEGGVTHLIPSGEDITARKQAEATLRDSEARFRLLFERNPAPMLVYERAGLRLLAVNEAFLRQYGYSLEEALAIQLPELYPEPEKAAIVALIPQLHGHAYVGEWHHLRKDGTLVDIVAYSHDIDFEGRNARIAVIHNITERKRAEEALRLSEARYRTLLENAPFPVVITRLRDGVLCYGNQRAEVQFGLARAQGIGQLASDFYLDSQERDRFLERLLRETTVINHELRLRAADGSLFWAQLSAAIIDFEGEPSIFTSINDISAHKQAEDKVQQLNTVLEQRVAERTAQLLAAIKELETFAYSVSHDLKAPLRGIDGYSRLLLEDHAAQLDDEGQSFLVNIRRGAAQMAQLIDDLLAYSRIERRDLRAEPVDLPKLVETVVAERAEEIAMRAITMKIDIPPQAVIADRDGMAIALRNLLDNALKFTRNVAQAVIEIGVRREPGVCILWVRDNGIGFDMKFDERIFEIFQRLQRAEDFPGTGIGLAIVRKAMQRMGGRAWAESTPGQGSTFFLALPL